VGEVTVPVPTISAVMPVRDGAPYLAASLDSVLAEPEITEVVVVDDGSTDATPEILAGYGDRIRVVRQRPKGNAGAVNRCIAESTGDLLALQDSDDLWPQGRTAVLLAALTDDLDGAYGWIEQFISPDLDAAERARLRVDTRPQASYLLQTMLIRRDVFARVGPYDETLTSSANVDWISRARADGLRTCMIPEVVCRRRVHRSNMGRTYKEQKDADLLRVVRAHLDRRRGTT
jgi:glycosyltransferase involved in cell wall biosynthesis